MVFYSGHCAGTVRGLSGHRAGTVEFLGVLGRPSQKAKQDLSQQQQQQKQQQQQQQEQEQDQQ